MSKRQFDTGYPRPNIMIVPTIALSGEDATGPPPKKPKLPYPTHLLAPEFTVVEKSLAKTTREIPQNKVELDTIPLPPLPIPKVPSQTSVTVSESDISIKNQVLSVTTKKGTVLTPETNVKEKVAVGTATPDRKTEEEVKCTSKQLSWASNYLMSIGLQLCKKPIKLNLSLSKKTNATPEDIKISENTEKKTPETNDRENSKENVDNPSDQKPTQTLAQANKNTDINPSDSQVIQALVPAINFPVTEIVSNSEIYSQPVFDNNHLATLHVNDNHPYFNLDTNLHNKTSSYATTSFAEFDRNKKVTYSHPAEDNSYLAKVEQFLAKLSYYKNEHEYKSKSNITAPKTTLNYHEVERSTNYIDKLQDFKNKSDNKAKILPIQYRDIVGEHSKHSSYEKRYHSYEKTDHGYDKSYHGYENKYHYNFKYTEKYNVKEEKTSLNKQNDYHYRENMLKKNYQVSEKSEWKDSKFLDKCKTRRGRGSEDKSNRSWSENKMFKRRSRSSSNSSSSEFVCNGSPCRTKQNKCNCKKRERATSCNCSANEQGRLSYPTYKTLQNKKHTIKEKRESCRGASRHCTSETKSNKRHKSIRESSSSSSNSENCRYKLTRQSRKKYNKITYKSKRERSPSKPSTDSEMSQNKLIKKVKKNKHESKRERSNSNSENSLDMSPHKSQRIKKRKRCQSTRSSSNDTRNKSPSNTPINEENKRDKNNLKISDNKTYRIIKHITKEKNKAKSPITFNIKSSKDELEIMSNVQKTVDKHNFIKQKANVDYVDKIELNQKVPMKSVVQVKDNTQQKSNTISHEPQPFDLRSKLSRKDLSHNFSKIRKQNQTNVEKNIDPRESLVITVPNQLEDKEEIVKTGCEKIREIIKNKVVSTKGKKDKKIKLVINVICENSQSSDSDGEESKTIKKMSNENKDTNVTVKKVITESNIKSNVDLSFLDDFNVDEIIDSLENSNKECTGENNSLNIDTFNLISESEHSDASTVYLEELCEKHDDSNNDNIIEIYENNSEKGSRNSKNNNILSKRADEKATEETINIKITISGEKKSPELTMISQNEIKDEILNDENKLILDSNTQAQQNIKCLKNVINLNEGGTLDAIKNNEIKKEPADEDTESHTVLANIFHEEILQKKARHTAQKESTTNEIKVVRGNMDKDPQYHIIPINEIKKEPDDDVSNEKIRDIGNNRDNTSLNKIKDEPIDNSFNEKTLENKNKNTKSKPISTNKEIERGNADECIENNNSLVEIKEEPTDKTLNDGLMIFDGKKCTERDLTPNNELCAKNIQQERIKIDNRYKHTEHDLIHVNKIKEEIPMKITHVKSPETTNNMQYPNKCDKVNKRDNTNKITEDKIDFMSKLDDAIEIKSTYANQLNNSTQSMRKPTASNKVIVDLSNELDVIKKEFISLNESEKGNDFTISSKNTNISDDAGTSYMKPPVTARKEIIDADSINKINLQVAAETSNLIISNKMCDTINASNNEYSLDKHCTDDSYLQKNSDTRELQNKSQNSIILMKKFSKISNTTEKAIQAETVNTKPEIENLDIEVSTDSKSDNTENKNENAKEEKLKSENHQGLATTSQKPVSNDTKTKNNIPERETVINSNSHWPVQVKETPSNNTESSTTTILLDIKPGEQSLVNRMEDRLLKYLHEPYTVTSLLHRGEFSIIYKCEGSKGQNYAIKMLRNNKNDLQFKGITKEKFLKSLQKDIPKENLNFVRIVNGLCVAGWWCLVMDFYPKNLSQALIENQKAFHINNVQHLSKQLVAAVMVLRHKNVVHSDIKPTHIMLNSSNDRLKLCGFDSIYTADQIEWLPPYNGTVNYRAPEIIVGHSAGYSIDVWSTALVMFEMATKFQLLPGHLDNDILFKQMCTLGYMPTDMIRLSRYGYKHFAGTNFMRRNEINGQIMIKSEQEIYQNNILRGTIYAAYCRDWASGISRKQKSEELAKLYNFCRLLEEMLVIHPRDRLPIEFVYTHKFLFDVCN